MKGFRLGGSAMIHRFLFTFSCFFLLNTVSQATPTAPQRRLVVVSSLETFGQAKYAWLYSFLDASTISMAQAVLGSSYNQVSVLSKQAAKKSSFISLLRNLTDKSYVKAVDVILSVHGTTNAVYFDDGKVTAQNLRDSLKMIPKQNKFRLMYNLACYGNTHSDEFRSAGFKTAIGSKKTNTASASEYPVFLGRWKVGHKVKDIIAQTNADPALVASDAAAGLMGFSGADSHKVISGYKSLTINSQTP